MTIICYIFADFQKKLLLYILGYFSNLDRPFHGQSVDTHFDLSHFR